jgi:hypothetical protein
MKLKLFALIVAFFVLGTMLQAQRLTIQAPDNAVTIPSTAVTITERDTLVGLFTFVWDDGYKDVFDSIAVFDAFGFDCSIALTPYQILHGDTTNLLTADKVRYLYNRGWDIGSQGYGNNLGALFNDDTSLLFTGQYTSLDTFEYALEHAVTAITDTLGLPAPRFWGPPSSGTWAQLTPLIAKYYEFGMCTRNTATGTSTNSRRQNAEYTLYALPSFDITDGLYLAGNAVKTKGWTMGIMHRPSTLATSTGESFTTICTFLDSLVDLGLLRVVTASQGYDLMYRTPVSAAANYMWSNFEDHDSDGIPDFFVSTDSVSIHADSIYGTAAVNYGHGGNGYMTLDWNCPDTYIGHGAFPSYFGGNNYSWHARMAEWVFPVPAGGRKTAKVEFFAQIDTTLHTIAETESIGVIFAAKNEKVFNRWGGTATTGNIEDAINAMSLSTKNNGVTGISVCNGRSVAKRSWHMGCSR